MKKLLRGLLLFTVSLTGSAAYALESQAASLMDIYELASKNDHQFRSEYAQYLADREASAINRAALLPDVTLTGTASETDTDTEPSGISSSTDASSTSYHVSLTQNLINQNAWHTYRQGQAQEQLAEISYQANEQELIVRTAQTYFDTLRRIDQLKTGEAEEKAQQTLLEQTKQRYEVGLIPLSDVHEVRAAYDNAVANRINSEANVGIQYDSLSVLTGEIHTQIAPLNNNFNATHPEPAEKSAWVSYAKENNLTLLASELSADVARIGARAAKSGHYPTLTGSLSYSDSNQEVEGTTSSDKETDSGTLSLNFSIPLYKGGRLAAQQRQAEQNAIRAEEQFLLAQRQTIQNTRSLYLSVTTAIAQIKARKQAIVSTASALEAVQAGYDAGTRNIVDVVDAQSDLYQAQRNYFDTLYDYIINTLLLKQAAGNLQVADLEALENSLKTQ